MERQDIAQQCPGAPKTAATRLFGQATRLTVVRRSDARRAMGDDIALQIAAEFPDVSFVIHQMGSVVGAWGCRMIFDMFGNYGLAWRFGASLGIVAGMVQILFGGPSGNWSRTRHVPVAG